jgi:hypothetical protein
MRYDFIYCTSNLVLFRHRSVPLARLNSTLNFPGNTCVVAMENPVFYPVKRFGPLFRGYNFRPLVLRMVWGINILLFATVFWAFVFCLLNFN